MINLGIHQLLRDDRLQLVAVGDGRHDALYGNVVPRHLAFNVKLIPKISAPGGNIDTVWRA